MNERGFVVGRNAKVADAWRWECFQKRWPFLQANLSAGHLQVELRSPWAVTCRLWWRLQHALEGNEYVSRTGDSFWLGGIARGQTERRARQILDCIQECKPKPDESFDIPPEFDSGQAECIWAEGLEQELVEGQFYEILEIPNMVGHVVVWRGERPPIVGIHLERFRFPYPDERAFVAEVERELRSRVASLWKKEHKLALRVTARRDLENGGFRVGHLMASLLVNEQESVDIAKLSECLGAIPERGDGVSITFVHPSTS